MDGSGVRSPAGKRSLASEAKVAQELPSNPSGAVTREKPGEKASTGTREYVAMLKTQIDDFDTKAVRLRAPGLIKKKNKMSVLTKKIDRAIRLLRQTPRDKGPIELAYSGGKDSDCILRLALMAEIPFDAIYKNTTIDPPGTIAHCKENGVRIINPKTPFLKLIERKGFPTRFSRFCCSELKEYKIHDVCIQGVRRAESRKRAERYKEPVICRFYGAKKNHVQVFLPLLEWTNDDVAEFIDRENIKCHP